VNGTIVVRQAHSLAEEDEMKRSRKAVFLSLGLATFAALPARVLAGTSTLTPGEYITEGGWGVLTISRSENRTTHFSLEAMGPNGHVCGLAGDVQGIRAILEVDRPDLGQPSRTCVVTFRPNAGGIEVSDSGRDAPDVDLDACRAFCGMRAHFEGEYLVPRPGCTGAERSATRARFHQLYAAKSYARAAAVLAPLLARCSKTLGQEADWIENDLAITQYHLGRFAGCRKTLAPLAKDAARTDEELRGSLLPTDFTVYFPIVQATRHNLELCARKGR
jgi:hypothetical protein